MMADNIDPELPEDLVDEQLRFLRDGGPEPDLSLLDEDVSKTAATALDVVEALVDAAPGRPQLAHDAVAVRLGFVEPPTGLADTATGDRGDPVTAAVLDLGQRFALTSSPAATDGTEFERRFECRSMVENVLVVVAPAGTSGAALSAHARSAFALAPDLSAVAYTTADGLDAVVFTYAESHRMLEPASGWTETAVDVVREPLSISLGRYIERSDPRWEQVHRLEASDVFAGIDADAANIVADARSALEAAAPKLRHKKTARAVVLGCDDDLLIGWAQRVQRGQVTAEDLVEELRDVIGRVS